MLPASGHDITRPLWRWQCHGLGRGHHDWEDRTLHSSGEISLGSTTETVSLTLLLRPTPVVMGMHSSLKTTMQETTRACAVKITCSFGESRLSHGQRSPQTCLQLTACGTYSGNVSGDVLTSHRTSTSSLMHYWWSGAESLKQPLGGSLGA